DRQIDTARYDHERGPHRHNRNKTRVLGQLREILGVEELIFFDNHRFALARGIDVKHALPLALRVGLESGDFDFPSKNGKQRSQYDYYHNEPAFLQSPTSRAWNLRG